MKRGIVIAALTSAIMAAFGGVSFAQPADQAPVQFTEGAEGSHAHSVAAESGCVTIDAVYFEPAARGLHAGSNASGSQRGPTHGGGC